MFKVRRDKNFPNFFFWFSCSEWFNSQKKAIFFLKISLRNVGDFTLFDPWRENQSFFWHAVFAKCYITLRRFYLEHFSKKLRAVFSKKPQNPIFARFLPKKRGSKYFFEKSGSVTFFHAPLTSCKKIERLLEPILRKVINERTNGRTNVRTGMNL